MTTPDELPRDLTVALLGGGNVGSQVSRLLAESADDLTARAGATLRLVGVGVRDTSRRREGVDPALITGDLEALASSGADIVVELLGGIEPARTLILAAMAAGSSVVTANKALLAEDGATLHAAAERHGVDLYYEAAVAGAIPILRPIRESLAGDKIRRVLGIVNGTTNFILSKMDDEGADYADVLAEAQALGYAEADPTADVEGYDAAAKAAILASLAFHTRVRLEDVYREGITSVSAHDVAAAREMGFVIKLLAVAELVDDDKGLVVRVHPAMVPRTHPLAGVRGAFNAVFVEAESAGQVMFYGRGAGGAPTASAVLGDIVAVARHRVAGTHGPGESVYADIELRPIGDSVTRYYVNLDVADRPGVLAGIAQAFADNGVSIQNVRQDGHGDDAGLVVRTHKAHDSALAATIERLRSSDAVGRVVGVMRVEGEDGR
ncbi:MAG: homoserine dehydrogenase [Actinobacteria bacterium]|uniref:Homoserine dehydrogenase n=1 Tax=freshwater metagenome TaxID=449393 RepID=A0A6J7S7J6_9ZZZZ|nr:homoserine dehydrogenase [Actinomycetota bacterium]